MTSKYQACLSGQTFLNDFQLTCVHHLVVRMSFLLRQLQNFIKFLVSSQLYWRVFSSSLSPELYQVFQFCAKKYSSGFSLFFKSFNFLHERNQIKEPSLAQISLEMGNPITCLFATKALMWPDIRPSIQNMQYFVTVDDRICFYQILLFLNLFFFFSRN